MVTNSFIFFNRSIRVALPKPQGKAELRHARNLGIGLLGSVFVFSIFVNILMLTGPLFMLQVYDRVLGSRSEETLVALFALVAALYALMGLLDYARRRLLARFAVRFRSSRNDGQSRKPVCATSIQYSNSSSHQS
jgi:ABC-type protease/lipase transport system fused ATPase/permease subunit